MIFVNLKTYETSTGEDAISLASILEKAAQENQIKIAIAAQASDIRELAMSTGIEIWAQHIDAKDYGAHTGATIAQALKEDGAIGTFLNHSEKKFNNFEELQIAHTHAVATGLKTLIFAADIEELANILDLGPTYAAYEPPELVASKETSVAKARPDIISKAVELAKSARIPLIVGAGIKDSNDVRKSIELGAVGVAVASSVVLSKDPLTAIEELIKGLL